MRSDCPNARSFSIRELSRRDKQIVTSREIESLGSKRKIWLWFKHDSVPWLFKYARAGTGEHWAEKLGCEMAHLIGMPSAEAELARLDGEEGVIVRSFVPWEPDARSSERVPQAQLVHGNEILSQIVKDYDKEKMWGHQQHSWPNIQASIKALQSQVGQERVNSILVQFAWITLLDALIVNTDRHHENWGVLWTRTEAEWDADLAPSFDHASSLGRELTDEKRMRWLEASSIAQYVRRARGGIFAQAAGTRPDNPIELVRWAAGQYPHLYRDGLNRLREIEVGSLHSVVRRLPDEICSESTLRFCECMLAYSLNELQEIEV